MKTQILAAIGETALQPAASLNAALAANDRVKYAFSLLQLAMTYAEHPEQPASTLKAERIGCGIDDPDLDAVIAGARIVGKSCRVPDAARIFTHIAEDMRSMAAPVLAASPDGFGPRLDGLLKALPAAPDGLLDPKAVSAMMQAGHDGPDSLHRLVTDLHKQLNAMQAGLAEERLDGAAVYNLAKADRPLVTAFMTCLNRTAKLKFNHPGLATTATRAGGRLVVQNDIGTTDAHVINSRAETDSQRHVYRCASGTACVLSKHAPTARGGLGERKHCRAGCGRCILCGDRSRRRKNCRRVLRLPCISRLAPRLFDRLEPRAQAIERIFARSGSPCLLNWAAESDIGHRGFLELGGERLVNQAIEATAGSSMHFGDRLSSVLGDAEALKFIRFVFQTATEGLLSGQSQALIHDRIRVTLAGHFSNEERQLLRLAADHAGLIFELATSVRDGLRADAGGGEKRSHHARRFEQDADHLAMETREAVRLRADYSIFLSLLEAADDAADELEDVAFLLDLDTLQGKALGALQALADLLAEASQEWINAIGHARQIGLAASSFETEDFVAAIDRVGTLKRQADEAERTQAAEAIHHAKDFRQLHLFTTIGNKLEAAADALKHASLILREHVLEDVIDG